MRRERGKPIRAGNVYQTCEELELAEDISEGVGSFTENTISKCGIGQ
jgi:hypothetical protein